MEEVHTPEVKTIEEVCAFLRVKPEEVVKTLIFSADGVPVAVLIRGDQEVNEVEGEELSRLRSPGAGFR